jgi:mono/diheme cytochrome c family protein
MRNEENHRVRRAHVFFARAVLLVACLSAANLARAADAENGKRLADRWCATCHVIDGAQQRASADVPAFGSIARRSDFDVGRLAYFLLEPHPKMPNMSLSRREAEDLAAFIAKLR